jgi:hypothetical protein
MCLGIDHEGALVIDISALSVVREEVLVAARVGAASHRLETQVGVAGELEREPSRMGSLPWGCPLVMLLQRAAQPENQHVRATLRPTLGADGERTSRRGLRFSGSRVIAAIRGDLCVRLVHACSKRRFDP